MEPSLSKILIDSCFPDSVRDDFKFIDTLDLVVGEDYDTVPMLEKQAARSIVRRAMTEKKESVLQAFQPNSPETYLPIILGHCDFATEFVMLNLSYGSEVRISVGTEILLVETGAGGQFTKNFASEPVPVEKALEIVRLLLRKNIKNVTVKLSYSLVETGKLSKDSFIIFLTTITQTIGDEYKEEFTLNFDFMSDLFYVHFVARQPTVA